MSIVEIEVPDAIAVCVTDDELIVELSDGRTISVPISWFPRLAYGTLEERNQFDFRGEGIHWPILDEDISVRTLLLGLKSGEGTHSLERWRNEMDRRRRDGTLNEPWGQVLPLPDADYQEE